jgi:hypothetical protein
VAKILATREAMGSMGSVQKAAIKGTLASIVVLNPSGEVIDASPSPNGSAKTGP